ncbi:MAG: phosphohydrolase [Deltaproteobacteria bacterium]|nr:MAG: phosphohydrolase [Deltaproteobacteria bacterium]
MKIYAISDLHLSFSGEKPMDIFGAHWVNHAEKIESKWHELVGKDDIVCLAGDLSWALKLGEVEQELEWLASLPGRKVLIKGNHDYWWSSISKVRRILPDGIYAIQNDSVTIDGAAFGGARGWVDPHLDFSPLFPDEEVSDKAEGEELFSILGEEKDLALYEKELARLKMSLEAMDATTKLRIALLHFPPAGPNLAANPVIELLQHFNLDHVVFGHLHLTGNNNFKNPYGKIGGATYYLTSADFINFTPFLIAEVD